ncbi:hypothetical protein ZWY2020_024652 [Hordeum vulgare]|nr:hypothetical protein ZWY2020_024652 [Hordeum vulgare]
MGPAWQCFSSSRLAEGGHQRPVVVAVPHWVARHLKDAASTSVSWGNSRAQTGSLPPVVVGESWRGSSMLPRAADQSQGEGSPTTLGGRGKEGGWKMQVWGAPCEALRMRLTKPSAGDIKKWSILLQFQHPSYSFISLLQHFLPHHVNPAMVVVVHEFRQRQHLRVIQGPLGSRAAKAIGFIEKMIEYSYVNAPLQKELLAEEVGNAAAFLVSPLASAITGSTVYVDNGLNTMALREPDKRKRCRAGRARAVGAAKEAVANVGASAWAGKEKTKAVVQETVNKAKAHDPAAMAEAEARKQERIHEVEAAKQRRHAPQRRCQGHAPPRPTTPPPAPPWTPATLRWRAPTQAGAPQRRRHGTRHRRRLRGRPRRRWRAPGRAREQRRRLPAGDGAGHAVGEGGGHQLPARGTPGNRSA